MGELGKAIAAAQAPGDKACSTSAAHRWACHADRAGEIEQQRSNVTAAARRAVADTGHSCLEQPLVQDLLLTIVSRATHGPGMRAPGCLSRIGRNAGVLEDKIEKNRSAKSEEKDISARTRPRRLGEHGPPPQHTRCDMRR